MRQNVGKFDIFITQRKTALKLFQDTLLTKGKEKSEQLPCEQF